MLDNSVGQVDDRVLEIIEKTLNDVVLLRQFSSSNVIRAAFVYSIGENLVILDQAESGYPVEENKSISGSVKIALSTGIVAIMLASIFLCGLIRIHKSDDAENRNTAKACHSLFYQAKKRQYFEQMEDEPSLAPGWMLTNGSEGGTATKTKTPSTTWSVSDITSDTQSIKECLPMDRIDEECRFELDEDDNCLASSKVPSKYMPSNHLVFMSKWNDPTGGSEILSSTDHARETVGEESIESTSKDKTSDDETSFAFDHQFDFQALYSVKSNVNSIEKFDVIPDYRLQGSRFQDNDESTSTDQNGVKLEVSNSYCTPPRDKKNSSSQKRLGQDQFFEASSQICSIAAKDQQNSMQTVHIFKDIYHGMMTWALQLISKLEKCKNQKLLTSYV